MPLPRLAVAPLAAALRLALFAALALAFSAAPAAASLLIDIDKSTQTMTVSRDGVALHRWPVSTGLRRYDTPAGAYKPFRMEKDHFSREWDDAPMPHSIFFTKRGHAIHGTTHLAAIGRPASHGCVRLEPQNARALFEMVKRAGMPNVRVVLRGETPPANAPAVARTAPYGGPGGYDDRPGFERREPGYIAPPWQRAVPETSDGPPQGPRVGYWVVHPDGSREFVDGERGYRPAPPPPPFFFGRPPGWN